MNKFNLSDEELYQLARKRLALKKAFFIHLLVYIAVMLLLIVINRSFSSSSIWFIYPLLGWGIGVAIHGATIYSSISSTSNHKIQREINKIKNGL